MKKLLKLAIVTILLTSIILSCSSCTALILMANSMINGDEGYDENSNEVMFYELVSENKQLLDEISLDISNTWLSNGSNSISAAIDRNQNKISTVKKNDERIIELFNELYSDYGDLYYSAEIIMENYNAYYTIVLNPYGKTYDFYIENVQESEYYLASSLRDYYVLL